MCTIICVRGCNIHVQVHVVHCTVQFFGREARLYCKTVNVVCVLSQAEKLPCRVERILTWKWVEILTEKDDELEGDDSAIAGMLCVLCTCTCMYSTSIYTL